MTINQERFPTYKPLSPVLRTQTTYVYRAVTRELRKGYFG